MGKPDSGLYRVPLRKSGASAPRNRAESVRASAPVDVFPYEANSRTPTRNDFLGPKSDEPQAVGLRLMGEGDMTHPERIIFSPRSL
jgi:hypothetical protein